MKGTFSVAEGGECGDEQQLQRLGARRWPAPGASLRGKIIPAAGKSPEKGFPSRSLRQINFFFFFFPSWRCSSLPLCQALRAAHLSLHEAERREGRARGVGGKAAAPIAGQRQPRVGPSLRGRGACPLRPATSIHAERSQRCSFPGGSLV